MNWGSTSLMRPTQKVMRGIQVCVTTFDIARHGFRVSRVWWNATAITQASSCGHWVMKRGTELFTMPHRRGFVRLTRHVRCITKVLSSMPDGTQAVLHPAMLSVRCTQPSMQLLNMVATVQGNALSSCASTAMQWATAMARCRTIGMHSKTRLAYKVASCGNGKITDSHNV
ncbi:unannotated protein [freshwater metagenome]|uniref:Unannotated protein n=1 Tax=freshwater metagenome TaxID=449393 RepID=A0A6J6I5S4_9ZZZZ